MDEEKDLFGLFDNAKVSSLDELSEDVSDETDIMDDEDSEEPYSYDEEHEYYSEEDDDDDEEEDEQPDIEEIEIGDFINVGDVFTFGDDEEEDFSIEMECVFKTWYEDNVYVLFHPKEAPTDSQFVPMCIELDEEDNRQTFSPVTTEAIAEQILQMYRTNKER